MNNTSRWNIWFVIPSLWLLGVGAAFAEGTAIEPPPIELVSSGKSPQGELVELVFLAPPLEPTTKTGGKWRVEVQKITGSGAQHKEETLMFMIEPGEKKPIGFGVISEERSSDQRASYTIVSKRRPRLW